MPLRFHSLARPLLAALLCASSPLALPAQASLERAEPAPQPPLARSAPSEARISRRQGSRVERLRSLSLERLFARREAIRAMQASSLALGGLTRAYLETLRVSQTAEQALARAHGSFLGRSGPLSALLSPAPDSSPSASSALYRLSSAALREARLEQGARALAHDQGPYGWAGSESLAPSEAEPFADELALALPRLLPPGWSARREGSLGVRLSWPPEPERQALSQRDRFRSLSLSAAAESQALAGRLEELKRREELARRETRSLLASERPPALPEWESPPDWGAVDRDEYAAREELDRVERALSRAQRQAARALFSSF